MSQTKGVVRRVLSALFVTALIGWISWEIAREASTYDWSSLEPQLLPLLSIPPLLLVLYVFRASLWTKLVQAMGADIDQKTGNRIFLAIQLGRYIPGKLWQIVGAGALAKHYGVSPRICTVAALIIALLHEAVGAAIGMLVVSEVLPEASWGVAIAGACFVLGLAFIASPLLPKSLALLGRILKRPQLGTMQPPPPRLLVLIALGQSVIWCGFGFMLWLTSVGLFPDLPAPDPILILGSMAASAVIGFAVLFAPSGIGVREAVLIALLRPSIGLVPAGFVALASRIFMTVTELGLCVWGIFPHLRGPNRLRELGTTASTATEPAREE